MSRLTQDGTAEPVSRDQILRRERGQGNINFPCSADHNWISNLTRLIHVCVYVVIPFILDVRFVDVPAGVTQEEGHTGFLNHLPSAVLVLTFLAEGFGRSIPSSTLKSNFVYERLT